MSPAGIAVRLLKSHYRSYRLYLITLLLSSAVYYNFAALKFHPQIMEVRDIGYVALAVYLCNILFVFIISYFMIHTNAFLLKSRAREIGLYFLMGIGTPKVCLVFALESLAGLISSLVLGLGIGILTSKLFVMGFAKMAVINLVIDFTVTPNAIAETAKVFLLLTLAVTLYNSFRIGSLNLTELLHYSRQAEQCKQSGPVKGILGVVLIGWGYIFCQGMMNNAGMLFIGVITLCVELIGTQLFWGSMFPGLLTWLLNNKKILYSGDAVMVLRNLHFRTVSNYKMWTMMSVCIAAAITMLTFSITLFYYITLRGGTGLQEYAQVSQRQALYLSGLFSYLGPVMAVIFLFVLGMTLYFRIMSEGLEERHTYELLNKLGVSSEEIKTVIRKQMVVNLAAPSILGILHAGVAVFLFEEVLAVRVFLPLLIATAVFSLLYTGLYQLMASRYFKQFCQPAENNN